MSNVVVKAPPLPNAAGCVAPSSVISTLSVPGGAWSPLDRMPEMVTLAVP